MVAQASKQAHHSHELFTLTFPRALFCTDSPTYTYHSHRLLCSLFGRRFGGEPTLCRQQEAPGLQVPRQHLQHAQPGAQKARSMSDRAGAISAQCCSWFLCLHL